MSTASSGDGDGRGDLLAQIRGSGAKVLKPVSSGVWLALFKTIFSQSSPNVSQLFTRQHKWLTLSLMFKTYVLIKLNVLGRMWSS